MSDVLQAGWEAIIIPFITVELLLNFAVEISDSSELKHSDAFVFTSKNAVKAMATTDIFNQYKDRYFFAVGESTAQELHKQGVNAIIPPSPNSISLAQFILEKYAGIQQLSYFCGNLRKDDLPQEFKKEGKLLHEMIVYNTKMQEIKTNEHYDAIVFYSPSAVKAYFKKNVLVDNSIVLSIGPITSSELRNYYQGEILEAKSPDTDSMISLLKNIN